MHETNLSKYILPILSKSLRVDTELAFPVLAAYANHAENSANLTDKEIEAIEQANEVKFVEPVFDPEGAFKSAVLVSGSRGIKEISSVPAGSVAIIPVNGVMMRESFFSWSRGFIAGTRDLEQIVKTCESSPNVDSIVFRVNSPGGEASGNESLSKVISKCKKPTFVSFETMASAAVEAFIGADEIFAIERDSKFGSIGVYASLMDIRGLWESAGVKFFEVYARQSTEKNKEIRELFENGNEGPLIERLSKTANLFIEDVKKARPQIKDDGRVFAGALYNAIEARNIKAIDGIKTFDSVIERAAVAGRRNRRNSTNQSKKTENMSKDTNETNETKEVVEVTKAQKKGLSWLERLFGKKSSDDGSNESEGNPKESEDGPKVEDLVAKIAELEGSVEEKSALIEQQKTTIEGHEKTIREKDEAIEKNEKKISEFEEDFASLQTAKTIEGENTFGSVKTLVEAYNKTFDHNKELGGTGNAPGVPSGEIETNETEETSSFSFKSKNPHENAAEIAKQVEERFKKASSKTDKKV